MNKQEFINYFGDLLDQLEKDNDVKNFFTDLDMNKLEIPDSDEIIIFQFNGFGDMILLAPFIRNVRMNNPDKKITLVCHKKQYNLVEYCPYVDKIITIELKESSFIKCFYDIFQLLKDNFWDHKYDLALAPQWGRTNFMAMLCSYFVGANRRVGYSVNAHKTYYTDPPQLYNDAIDFDTLFTDPLFTPEDIIYELDRRKYMLEYLNYSVDDMHLEAWLTDADERFAKDFIKDASKIVVLGTGGTLGSKRYPLSLLAEAVEQIQKENPNIIFLILGGQNVLEGINCIKLDTSLRQSIALMKYCTLYIGNDTVTSHMAAIFKLPEIVLFMEAKDKQDDAPGHLSSVQRFKPFTDKLIILQPSESIGICREAHIHGGCYYDYPHCITQIKPKEIVDAFNSFKNDGFI